MLVKSREHGRKRHHRYACSSYHLRGRSVCPNHLELPLAEADAQMLDAIEGDILAPDVVDLAIEEAIGMLTAPPAPAQSRCTLRRMPPILESIRRPVRSAWPSGRRIDFRWNTATTVPSTSWLEWISRALLQGSSSILIRNRTATFSAERV
jgi:hypothetical protein